MKRGLCLLLCLLMLFCIGCHKEAPKKENASEPELGTRYVSAGNVYNTHIRLRLVTEELKAPAKAVSELRAPVSSLSFELQNDTDYFVNLGHISEWLCEKWENGEWIIVPAPYIIVDRDILGSPKLLNDWVKPHSTETFTKHIVPTDPTAQNAFKDREPLSEGVYRMKHTVLLTKEQTTGGTEYTVEVYFTVAPSLD